MDSQQNSQSIESYELQRITEVGGKLDFIFKRSIFWRPTYLAQSAWLEHIPFAFWLVETLQPRNIVELGTHYGSSYFSFCQAVTKLDLETCCFAVDTWGGDEHAGQYGEEVYKQVSEYNQQHYSGFSTLIRSTFDQALEHFPQGSIDLLHIDGLHTLEAVRHDFESWLPKLSEKAVVIMHDTNVRQRGFGVFQLLDELKQQYPHFEFAHGHGLGVIGVGETQSVELNRLYEFSENARATKQVQDIFYCLGKSCGENWDNLQLKRQLITQQDEIQAEQQLLVEQQALERGRLAERITAQHHRVLVLEGQLSHAQAQADELALAQQQGSSLTSEIALLQQQLNEAQTNVSVLSQKRSETNDELQIALHQLEQQQTQITSQEQAHQLLKQQLNTQTLQLSDETQRAANLTLALSKSNAALVEHSRQITALQFQLEQALHAQDEQDRTLIERDNTVNLLQQQANALLQQLDDEKQTKSQLQHAYGLLEAQRDTLCLEHEALKQVSEIVQQKLEQAQLEQQSLQQSKDEQTLALVVASKQCDELAQRIAVHEATIVSYSDQMTVQQADHLQLTESLSALQQQLTFEQTAYQQEISTRDQALTERFSETAMLTRLLEEQAQTFTEQETEKQQLAIRLSGVEQQLTDVQQQSQRQQAEQEDQTRELTARNQRLEANIAERFCELAIMTDLVEQQSRGLRNGEQQIEQLKARINKLKGTVSWRLTAPVRALAKPFKKVSHHSISQVKKIAESGYFDEEWYRQQYPESARTGSAIEHYLNIGAGNGYNPGPKFDTLWYLTAYPDVATGDINPLLHFIMHGQHEGRLCRSES